MDKKQSLGQIIEDRRKELDITAEALANAIGIDRTYISKIENHNLIPSYDIIISIASELELGKDFLDLYWKINKLPLGIKKDSPIYKALLKFGDTIHGEKKPTKDLSSIMYGIQAEIDFIKPQILKEEPEISNSVFTHLFCRIHFLSKFTS